MLTQAIFSSVEWTASLIRFAFLEPRNQQAAAQGPCARRAWAMELNDVESVHTGDIESRPSHLELAHLMKSLFPELQSSLICRHGHDKGSTDI
jgi:hypothetical protein